MCVVDLPDMNPDLIPFFHFFRLYPYSCPKFHNMISAYLFPLLGIICVSPDPFFLGSLVTLK